MESVGGWGGGPIHVCECACVCVCACVNVCACVSGEEITLITAIL